MTPEAPLRQPSLRQLRGFVEVARHASFSRAAQALALSQPALSSAIRELEAALGAPLFDRSTSPIQTFERLEGTPDGSTPVWMRWPTMTMSR